MGISHFTTPPHTPEQNGVAERRHRHIVETGLSLLHYAHLPLTFWSHAFQTAVYLINRLPTPILDSKTPFQTLHGQPPSYTKLKPFGCLCYPWLRPYASSKLEPRSSRCLFLGYSSSKAAYKCLDLTSHKLYHSRHVQFVENQFPYTDSLASPLPSPDSFLTTPIFNLPQPPTLTVNPTSQPPTTIPPTAVVTLPQPTTSSLVPTESHPPSNAPTPSPTSLPDISQQPPFTSTAAPIDPRPTITYSRRPRPPNPSPSATDSQSTSSRPRKPNPKYFNDNFVNLTTLHPIPTTIEPTTVSQAQKDPK